VISDGKAVAREVRLGAGNDITVEVLNGLAAGETLIVSDLDKVREGASVKAK
jgi:hypothetical protein